MTVKITKKEILLGKRIKRVRRRVGLTQETLAEKASVSTTHIGLVETGKRRVSLKTLQRIATALGVKTKELIPF